MTIKYMHFSSVQEKSRITCKNPALLILESKTKTTGIGLNTRK